MDRIAQAILILATILLAAACFVFGIELGRHLENHVQAECSQNGVV